MTPPNRSMKTSWARHRAESSACSTRSMSIPEIVLRVSPAICLNRHLIRSDTLLSCSFRGSRMSGSGMLILSICSWMNFSVSLRTTPLTLPMIPSMNLAILDVYFSTSAAKSSTSPVLLLINSPISFFSIPRAYFRNSAIAPLIFTSEG